MNDRTYVQVTILVQKDQWTQDYNPDLGESLQLDIIDGFTQIQAKDVHGNTTASWLADQILVDHLNLEFYIHGNEAGEMKSPISIQLLEEVPNQEDKVIRTFNPDTMTFEEETELANVDGNPDTIKAIESFTKGLDFQSINQPKTSPTMNDEDIAIYTFCLGEIAGEMFKTKDHIYIIELLEQVTNELEIKYGTR